MTWGRILLTACLTIAIATTAWARPPKLVIKASSTYDDQQNDWSAEMAFDGRLDTSWSEGQAGAGIDEWIEIDFGEFRDVTTMFVWSGDFSGGSAQFGERNRMQVAEVILTTESGERTQSVDLGDRYSEHEIRVNAPLRKVRIVIKAVYAGSVFDNTHIAEIAFDYPARLGEASTALAEWMETDDYEEANTAYEDALYAAYQEAKAGEDYSRNFKFIARAAVHGAPYMLDKVLELAPPGYRMAFLDFDETAIKYLQKLRDVNIIPFMETGVARAQGEDRYWLEDLLKAFRAHETLISSRRPSIPNWGITGLEPGALNGRGEPLSIDVNTAGRLYVADTGNNRVQWFSTDGRLEGRMGAEEGIAWSWFGAEGDPYATGAAPGDGAKEYEQPVYLAVGNYDVLAVIDSTLRVQTFDDELNPIGAWTIPSEQPVRPGTGCSTPIVTWWGDIFYFLLGNEVWGYQTTGEQVIKFTTADEILAGVILDGKLLVRHEGRDITEYALADGFNQGSWLRKPLQNDGSEDWDVATDAEDNLYIATDAGWLYIYNKRGKFVRKEQFFEYAKNAMRICVSPDMTTLYITAEDTIHRHELSE